MNLMDVQLRHALHPERGLHLQSENGTFSTHYLKNQKRKIACNREIYSPKILSVTVIQSTFLSLGFPVSQGPDLTPTPTPTQTQAGQAIVAHSRFEIELES